MKDMSSQAKKRNYQYLLQDQISNGSVNQRGCPPCVATKSESLLGQCSIWFNYQLEFNGRTPKTVIKTCVNVKISNMEA